LGLPVGSGAFGPLVHLVALVLVVCAVAIGLRRLLAKIDLLVMVVTLAFVIVVVAFVLGTKQDENEIVGLLPLGAVLAGRVLAAARRRARGRGAGRAGDPGPPGSAADRRAADLCRAAGLQRQPAGEPRRCRPARTLAGGAAPDVRPGELLDGQQHHRGLGEPG